MSLVGKDIATLTNVELVTEISRLLSEVERLRQFLFPYADRTDISGISWDGKYLIGDKASIKAFHEMKNRGEQIDVYQRAYDQNEAALKAEAEYLRGVANDIQKGYIEATERAEEAVTAANALQVRTDAAEAEVNRLQAEIDRKSSMPGDHRYWEGRYRDEAAENEKLREALEPFRTVSKDWVDENGWTDVACQKDRIVDWFGPSDFRALASTGGEQHDN